MIIIYVNNLLIVNFKSNTKLLKLKKKLVNRFKIINLKLCYYYLNIKITRNCNNRTLHLLQRIYIKKILKRFDILNCKIDIISILTLIYLVSKTNRQTFKEIITHY